MFSSSNTDIIWLLKVIEKVTVCSTLPMFCFLAGSVNGGGGGELSVLEVRSSEVQLVVKVSYLVFQREKETYVLRHR